MQNILVIIPTFNERENIGTLIDGIMAQPPYICALIVDDGSPDGTAEIVRAKQKQYGESRLQLIVRMEGKAGRGSACMVGFRMAREKGYDAAIEMDADLSHDPKDIPRFIAGLAEADVVIGSKYVKGGKVIGWEWYRHLLSRSANFYARIVLSMPTSDNTNGYRCYGSRALAFLPDLVIDGTGFTVIPQMAYQLYGKGMRLKEIPIVFTNRRRGTSNMSMREMTEGFLSILKIRSHTLHLHFLQLFKFVVTGVSNLTLDLALLAFFVEIAQLQLLFAAPLTSIIVLINVFFMNKYWTFRNAERKHVAQGIKFALVYSTSFILVNALTWGLSEIAGIWYLFSRMIAIAICALWNYLWLHFGVFKKHT
jgi:dolichol-phosphate mannosyltransferase